MVHVATSAAILVTSSDIVHMNWIGLLSLQSDRPKKADCPSFSGGAVTAPAPPTLRITDSC